MRLRIIEVKEFVRNKSFTQLFAPRMNPFN